MKKTKIFFSDWNKTYSRLSYNIYIYISQLQYISKSTYAPQNVDNLERTGICISRRDTFLDHLYRWSKTRFLHKLEDIPVFWFLDFARPDFVIALGPKMKNKQNKYAHTLRVICINMAAVQVVLVPVCKPMGNVK